MSVILIDPYRFGVAAANPSISYIVNSAKTGAGTTHNWTSGSDGPVSIGATGTNRVIIVAISCYSAAAGTLDSATIGGVAATICVQAAGTTTIAAIIAAAVPTGTTADIVLNWSSSNQNVAIAVYRAVDLTSATQVTSGSDTTPSTGAVSFTLNNNANSIMVASAVSIDGTAWGTWSSGLTEDSDQFVASSNAAAAASGVFASANTPYTVTATAATGTRGVAVAATWNN